MPLTGFRCCLQDFWTKSARLFQNQQGFSETAGGDQRKWSPNTKTRRTQGARALALLHGESLMDKVACTEEWVGMLEDTDM